MIALLKEVQQAYGCVPQAVLTELAKEFAVKEGFFLALMKRISGLRLGERHCLELCAGPNCSRRKKLAEFVETTWGTNPEKFTVKYVPCMRQCGKGPNIRWDGQLYNGAEETLLRRLIEGE